MGTVRDSFRADGAYGQFGLVFPHQALCVIINAATEQTQTILDLAGEWLVPDGSETDPAENGRPVSLTLSLRPLLACRNPVFEEDMKRLCALPVMEELRGRTVLVTGATGLIGQTLVSALLRYGGDDPDAQIRVIACVRSEEKARRLFGAADRGNLDLMITDIQSMPEKKLSEPVDYVIHAASQTSSRAFVDQPVETIFTAVEGTRRALEFAKNNNVRCFIYLSTMEVYGAPSDDHKIDETHGTNLDTMQPRSCYP